MCFIHRTHYSARHLSGTFEKCWLPWSAKVGRRRRRLGQGEEAESGRSSSKWGHHPFSLRSILIWTWNVSAASCSATVLWIECMNPASTVDIRADVSTDVFYFWTHNWNRVYYYHYCQPSAFNSLMIVDWIRGSLRRAAALLSPAVNVKEGLQLNRQRLAPT